MGAESSTSLGSMPNWVAIYLAAYITFSLWAFKEDLALRRFTVMVFIEAVGCISLIVATLAYWYFQIRSLFFGWSAWFFAVGAFCLIIFTANQVRMTFTNLQLSLNERIWYAVSGVGLVIFVNLPLIWFGSQLFQATPSPMRITPSPTVNAGAWPALPSPPPRAVP